MGRHATGAAIVEHTARLCLSFLIKKNLIRKEKLVSGSLSFSNGFQMLIECFQGEHEKYVRLIYTSEAESIRIDHDYKIKLVAKPSNLGKGEVLYFVCPISNRLCRNLYFANRFRSFVSRQSCPFKIYYRSQLSSKLGKANDQYWAAKATLEKIAQRKEVFKYQGKKTRYALRVARLSDKQYEAGRIRMLPRSMPLLVRRAVLKEMFRKRKS